MGFSAILKKNLAKAKGPVAKPLKLGQEAVIDHKKKRAKRKPKEVQLADIEN